MANPTNNPGLVTVGHGRADQAELGALLTEAGIELLVDVRRFPGSRNNPAVSRDALPSWLSDLGIAYRWAEDLGGRRRLSTAEDEESEDTWWTVAAFRAYAAHTRTPEFRTALAALLEESAERRVAIMCSESVWWRCHRRLIADVAVVGHGREVLDLMHDGRMEPHRVAEGARLREDGLVVWDRRAATSEETKPRA